MDKIPIQTLDLQHSWHPCSQMKDYEQSELLVVKRAKGCYIELADGRKIIDAISSWWCKSLGHNHPVLKKALQAQLARFEHVIFANTTHETIAKLSQKLAHLDPRLSKVLYAGDGSCAVEMAMKLSLHLRKLAGTPARHRFVALQNGYHGETVGALSVSDLGRYRDPYAPLLFDPILITPPYVTGPEDPLWHNAEDHWKKAEKMLAPYLDSITAIIFEPILQGAAGMRVYSQDFLHKMATWARENGIHLIADEIMTGIGRTGTMLACEHAKISPDFLCLSKGLTSGWVPFSVLLTTEPVYLACYDDYETGKAFLHSHTYSGNALGASVALATLQVMQQEQVCAKASVLQQKMRAHMQQIQAKTGALQNIRGIGAAIAADVSIPNAPARLGYRLAQAAIKRGALLRPLDNSIYWIPPLIISDETLAALKAITQAAILHYMPTTCI